MDILSTVREYVRQHELLAPGDAVVVGVSGGPDSVALLDVLRRLAGEQRLRLHAAHLHHGLRGADADADADFVMALAERWDLPCTMLRIDLPQIAREEGLALEEAARRVRYAFLAQTARRIGAGVIAVGHNADDQAETVLMHLLRGAGLAGLRGMLPATPLEDYRLLPFEALGADVVEAGVGRRLIRPLLPVPRAEIEAYCDARGLTWRVDRSNWDTTFFRNQLRHEVLPYLAEINPRIHERFCHLAEVVRADYEVLEAVVQRAWEDLLVARHSDAIAFDLAGWRAQPLAVQRSLIRRAAYTLRRTLRDVNFVHVQHAVQVAACGQTGDEATLPRDLVARVGYDRLTIADVEALRLPEDRPWLPSRAVFPVATPGVTSLPNGWRLRAMYPERWTMAEITANPDPLTAWLDAEAVGVHPLLRTRRPGDRFAPHGMGGAHVHVSDFLINVKVPQRWRDHLPLLVGEAGILWIVGWRVSEHALVRGDSARVVQLSFLPPF
ncbi:MAG: tRNA lysidine(34) synthetase TilS [Anaerolineae bacterium]